MADARAGLSLEDKVARLFWVTVYGPTADTEHPANRAAFGVNTPAEVIARHRPGGVVLFTWAGNTGHPLQVAQLTRDLRAVAAEAGYPLAVAIDEEGGRVTRLGPPATAFPSARAVAAAGDTPLALRRWQAAGRELAAVGVTANLAPVADLAHPTNPVLGDRAFAEDPPTVAAHAALAVRGLRAAGVAAVAKHFPGHGATGVDSHEALPVVHLSRAALEPHVEAFRRLLATAPPAGVMTAHLLVGALDATNPATLSPAVTSLLRADLGYDGALLTDSLSMAGIRARAGDGPVAVAALAAGADVLVTPPDLPGAIAAVCHAVRAGRITEKRVDDALRRAATLARPGGGAGGHPRHPPTTAPIVGHPDHRTVAAAIARRAVRVAADPRGRLPLADRAVLVLGTVDSGARALADALRRRGSLAALFELAARGDARRGLEAAGQAAVDRTNLVAAQPAAGDLPRLAAAAWEATLVMVRRVPDLDAPAQDRVYAQLAHEHPHAVLVDTGGTPATWAGDIDIAVLVTHGGCATSMAAAAEVLAGPGAAPGADTMAPPMV